MITQFDLERVARMLTHEFGVQVVVSGTECKTDGKVIYLPNLPPELGSTRVLSLIRYFLDHECGHLVGKTKFHLMAEWNATDRPDGAFILNTLEDVRVESIMSEALAGCGVNLKSGASIVGEALAEKAKAGDEGTLHPLKQFATCIYQVGRGLPIPEWIDKRVKQVLGPYLMKVRAIPQWAKRTDDLQDLTSQLMAVYRKLTAPPPPPPQQQQPDASGQGQQSQQPQPQQENADGTPPQSGDSGGASNPPPPADEAKGNDGASGHPSTEHPEQPPPSDGNEAKPGDGEEVPESGDTPDDKPANGEPAEDAKDADAPPDETPPDSTTDDINDAIDKEKQQQPPTPPDGGDGGDADAGPDEQAADGDDATDADADGGDDGEQSEGAGDGGPSDDGTPEQSSDSGDGSGDSDGDASDGSAADGSAASGGGEGGPEGAGSDDGASDGAGGNADTGGASAESGGGSGADDSVAPMLCDNPLPVDFKAFAEEAGQQIAEEIEAKRGELAVADPFALVRHFDPLADEIKDIEPWLDSAISPYDQRHGGLHAMKLADFLTAAKQAGGPMRQKLSQLLMAEARSRWQAGLKRGSPDPRKLAALITGTSNRVMRKFVEETAPDTAVSLLIDLSGSMNSANRWLNAGMAAACFSQVMDSCGHANTVLGFRNGGDHSRNILHLHTVDTLPTVGHGVTLWRGKRWTESFRSAAPKIRKLVGNVGGGTPLASSILCAARDLLPRREKRKVLMVFTDGQPDNELNNMHTIRGNQGYGVDRSIEGYIRYICAKLEKMGVEVVLIGIGMDAVRAMHTRTAVCLKPSDLATTTMNELTKALHAGVHI